MIWLVVWALGLTLMFRYFFGSMYSTTSTTEIQFSEFIQLVEDDMVASVKLESGCYTVTLTEDGMTEWLAEKNAESEITISENTTIITAPVSYPDLALLFEEHGVEYGTPYQSAASPIVTFLVNYILPMVIMVGLLMLLFRVMGSRMGGMNGVGGVGKSNAKMYVEKSTGVTFKDVAGQDEAKESLVEIIDFLHNPGKYTAIGAKLPKGALLVGSPGTGKTLLAKAVAGEAGVPFFSISGSDFVEMFVGVGASRVRDLFKEAAKMAPCIIFIDEIDTIGKTRDNRMGGNDEREQTLNQLLAELDGFDPTKGVIVLGATNRPEVLDKALLRPGRFDRRITVDRPNLAGRVATLKVHTRNIHLAEDVDLNKIAQATAGCVGADLANLVNEAALRAVRKGRNAVTQEDLLASFELVIAGAEKKGTVLTEKEKRMIAYHEVGHALVAVKQKGTSPVSKITIVPHTQGALGYTMQTPEEEKFLMDKEELLADIRTFMGGRAAEHLVFNTMTTGAANDIERATDEARKMVTLYGMSDTFGVMGLATIQSRYLDGGMGLNCAEETAAKVDAEVKEILNSCFQEAVHILEENRDLLDQVAQYLLKKETITGQELMAIIHGEDPDAVDNYGVKSGSSTPEPKALPADPTIEKPARHISMDSSVPTPPSAGNGTDEPTPEKQPDDTGDSQPSEPTEGTENGATE
ncbi:MAG: ATP-dependent zinc metalloprotease FtsH [Oscillospiraceae bacterium]|nr:ATP-dependent zinc metalloprotease FtsH [Oscillospiraceae bacterium]